jgi:subtilisin-like proprotein convertase family protein
MKQAMATMIVHAAADARREEPLPNAARRRQAPALVQRPAAGHLPRLLVLVGAALVAVLAAMTFLAGSASAASAIYTNSTPIGIPVQGTATPYPSPIQVSGMPGPVDRLVVTLHGVTHPEPRDLDVMLVSPGGRQSIVMSDACGSPDVQNRTWVFPSTGNFSPMPQDYCETGVYRATDYGLDGADQWPGAPQGALRDFTQLNGVDPNGTWNLYVADDELYGSGTIQGGWSLGIEATPADVFIPGSGTSGPANPYSVTRTVSGMEGVITDVNVALSGVSHRRPDDLDMLLVGPQGQKVMLMSDACGDGDVESHYWTWNDEASRVMPDSGSGDVCPNVTTYRPTDHEPGDTMPPPAPPDPYSSALSAFDFTDPNGEWRLFINDDSVGEAGWLATANSSPLAIGLTTRPRARVAFAADAATVTESETAQLALRRAGAAELGPGTVTVTTAPDTAASEGDFKPLSTTVEFAAGQTEKSVAVETLPDSVAEGDETFSLVIGKASGDAAAAAPVSASVTIRDAADVSAPETTIDKAPTRRTQRATARLRFSASEPGSSFECRIDRRKFKPCSSPRRLKRLAEGKHRFAVQAVDPAGNVDPTPAKRRWRVTRTQTSARPRRAPGRLPAL